MATLRAVALLAILDSLAAQAQVVRDAIGASDVDTGSVAEGAANTLATLFEEISDDNDLGGLILAAQRRQADITADRLYRALQGERMQVALDAHYGGTGSLNRFLTDENARAHPDVRLLGIQIDAVNAFAPARVTLGAFAVSGSGAGTYTADDAVDTSLYGNANLVVRTTSGIGGASITATLTLRRFDGSTTTKAVTIPGGTASGVRIDVGTHGTDMAVACTAVSITGGTSGDAFVVETEVERAVAL